MWLDAASPLSANQLAGLDAAGLRPVCLSSPAELARELPHVSAVVIRLGAGIAPLEEMQQLLHGLGSPLPVVCRVERQRLELGVQAMHAGAAHVLCADDWSLASWQALSNRLGRPAAAAQQAFVFVDPVSQKLLELARRVAQAEVTTLLTGPTGAGKEVLARVLHDASPRRHGPFVAINCAAMPESMIEDLLFGHEKGAFTGATREHRGVFEQAEGGSLFLDEIAELPYALQAKLLRVLQERQVTRLGAQRPEAVNLRLIAATNEDLRAAILAREFREDLYFRISTFRLRIPALAERPQDILPLALHMLNLHDREQRFEGLTDDAEALLLGHDWPGNVRELSNVMQRALVLCCGTQIGPEHLLFDQEDSVACPIASLDSAAQTAGDVVSVADPCQQADRPGLLAVRRVSEHRAIVAALTAAPNRVAAAQALGISPRTLRYKLAQLRDHGLAVAAAK